MGQTWSNDLSDAESRQPVALWRRIWFWSKQIVLFPVRMAGLLLVFLIAIGGFGMWVIPDMAERYNVDMVLLVLRLLDEEGAGRPFRRLGYQDTIAAGLLQLQPDPDSDSIHSSLKDPVLDVTKSPTPEGEAYVIRFRSGKTQTLIPTTPHTTVPREELAAARQAVSRLVSPQDRQHWTEFLQWGESLFVTSWVQKYELTIAPRDRFPGPVGGTEDEQIWCVWQVLRCGGAPEEDLFHLPELFRAAFPRKEDQEAALAWANTLSERLNNYFLFRKRHYATIDTESISVRAYAQLPRVVPPDTEWSRLWLLQQYIGLSPAAQTAARQRWLSFFPDNRSEQVLSFGESLVEERRAKGEPLPNIPEVLPALCVFERLTGTDGAGQSCDNAMSKMAFVDAMHTILQVAYPNDDLYYLLGSGDRLHLYPIDTGERGSFSYYITVVGALPIIAFIAALGMQTAIQWFLSWVVLRKNTRPLWRKHLEGRGEEPWYLAVVGIVISAAIGVWTAPFSLPDMIAIQISSPAQLLIGAVLATICGGLLIGTFRRLSALFFVAFGVDIEETWADEILGIILGGLILYHFGNDFLAIGLFALSDFLPALLYLGLQRLLRRGGSHSPAAAKAAPVRVAPALSAGSLGTRVWPFDDLGR